MKNPDFNLIITRANGEVIRYTGPGTEMRGIIARMGGGARPTSRKRVISILMIEIPLKEKS